MSSGRERERERAGRGETKGKINSGVLEKLFPKMESLPIYFPKCNEFTNSAK